MEKFFSSSNLFKKIAATIALVFTIYSGYSFTAIEAETHMNNCGLPVVFIPDSLQSNLGNVDIDIEITTDGGTSDPSYSNDVSLTDSNYFVYLGYVILDPTDSVGSIRYAYQYISTDFTPDVSGITVIDINVNYYAEPFQSFGTIQKNCVACPTCLSRYSASIVFSRIFTDVLYGCGFAPYDSSYNSLSSYNQQVITTIMNWLLNNNAPTVTDYADLLNPSNEGNSTLPSVFCSGSGSGLHNTCNDQATALNRINLIDGDLSNISTDDFDDFVSFNDLFTSAFLVNCPLSGGYFPYMYSTETPDGYEAGFMPMSFS